MAARDASRAGPDPIDVAVGAHIRIRRRWLGFSQTNLADALGITFQQVQKYERGANRVSASMLVKIAAKLETTVAALVGEDGHEPVGAIIYGQLATAGATDLLAAFAAMDRKKRRVLLAVAQTLTPAEKAKAADKKGRLRTKPRLGRPS